MSRPPVFSAEDKIRIVLSVLAGEMTIAEAARRNKVSETSVGKWKQQFPEAGKLGLAAGGGSRPSTREQALAAEVAELTTALGEAAPSRCSTSSQVTRTPAGRGGSSSSPITVARSRATPPPRSSPPGRSCCTSAPAARAPARTACANAPSAPYSTSTSTAWRSRPCRT